MVNVVEQCYSATITNKSTLWCYGNRVWWWRGKCKCWSFFKQRKILTKKIHFHIWKIIDQKWIFRQTSCNPWLCSSAYTPMEYQWNMLKYLFWIEIVVPIPHLHFGSGFRMISHFQTEFQSLKTFLHKAQNTLNSKIIGKQQIPAALTRWTS